jgi:alanyl-tRNA synthetase
MVALASVNEGKASLVVGVSDDLARTIEPVRLVRLGAALGGVDSRSRVDDRLTAGPKTNA